MFETIIESINPYFVVIPIVGGLLYYPKLGLARKIIFYEAIFVAISNATTYFFLTNQIPLPLAFIIFGIIDLFFLSSFYMVLLGKPFRKAIYAIMICFPILCIINYLFVQKDTLYSTYTGALGTMTIVAMAMAYIYKRSDQALNDTWGAYGLNWINAGILLYHSTRLVVIVFLNMLISFDVLKHILEIHSGIQLIQFIFFVIGFSKCKT